MSGPREPPTGLGSARLFLPRKADGAANFVSASDELKNKTVCEDQELKLHCHESKFLNIYSATYGHRARDWDVCASGAQRLPPFGRCLYVAVCGGWLPGRDPRHGLYWVRGKVTGKEDLAPLRASCCPTLPHPSIVQSFHTEQLANAR